MAWAWILFWKTKSATRDGIEYCCLTFVFSSDCSTHISQNRGDEVIELLSYHCISNQYAGSSYSYISNQYAGSSYSYISNQYAGSSNSYQRR
jgi:hypothetical protein